MKFLTNALSCSLHVFLLPRSAPQSHCTDLCENSVVCILEQLLNWPLYSVSALSLWFVLLHAASSLSQGSANAAVLDVSQTGGHKKRVRRSSFLNAKKLYEDAQMARKVKQYLSQLSLETNEESLQTLSLQCEPSISTRKLDGG